MNRFDAEMTYGQELEIQEAMDQVDEDGIPLSTYAEDHGPAPWETDPEPRRS